MVNATVDTTRILTPRFPSLTRPANTERAPKLLCVVVFQRKAWGAGRAVPVHPDQVGAEDGVQRVSTQQEGHDALQPSVGQPFLGERRHHAGRVFRRIWATPASFHDQHRQLWSSGLKQLVAVMHDAWPIDIGIGIGSGNGNRNRDGNGNGNGNDVTGIVWSD